MEYNPYLPPKSSSTLSLPDDNLATRWDRLWASLIDALAVMLFYFPIVYFFDLVNLRQELTFKDSVIGTLIYMVLYLVLNGHLLHTAGQTLGKKAIHIKIVDYHTGELLPLSQLILKRLLPLWIIELIPIAGSGCLRLMCCSYLARKSVVFTI